VENQSHPVVNPQNSYAQIVVRSKLNEMENAENLVGFINAPNVVSKDLKKG